MSPTTWCDKHAAAQLVGLSPDTLKKLRLRNELVEGIHWVRHSSRCIRYNSYLLSDWAANRGNPPAHQQAIKEYLNTLASRRRQKR
jgi:hypothetical protein